MRFDRATLNRLFHYAFALSGDREQAADLVQDTVEKLLRRPSSGSPLSSPQAFAKRTLRNTFYDQCRHRQVVEQHQQQPPVALDGERTLEQMVIDEDQLTHLWAQLQPQERELLYLWAVDDLSMAEIAERLNVPRGTLLSRVHRLRLRLHTPAAARQREGT